MKTAFFFDLDGTLLDSKGDLADAANAARHELGLVPLTDEAVERHTGWGMAALLAGVLPEADTEMLARGRVAFIRHYQSNLLVRSRPYPGVELMFERLADRPLGLVTNKPSMFARPILDALGWRDRFAAEVFGDSLPERKPDPEPLLHAIRAAGRTPSSCVFVGDTVIDRDTAAHADVRFVCVGWGRAADEGVTVVRDLATLGDLFP
jgi:phosphoglycolate phosphatase